MFRKSVRQSILSVVVTGVVLALTALVAPAATAAPQAQNLLCGYQGCAATNTSMRLTRPVGYYKQPCYAHAHVTSGAGTPKGHVEFRIPAIGWSAKATLSHGRASHRLPVAQLKPGHTYRVYAVYAQQGNYGRSVSGNHYYTVKKR
ncbi:MAG: Ig-like domain-containing protein [Nocardioidaceae bacterium]